MSVKLCAEVWGLELEVRRKAVLLALADIADDGGFCFPAVAAVAQKAGVGPRQAQRILRELEGAGLLEVAGHAVGGRGRTRLYRVVPSRCVQAKRVTSMSPFTELKGDSHVTLSGLKGDSHVTLSGVKGVSHVTLSDAGKGLNGERVTSVSPFTARVPPPPPSPPPSLFPPTPPQYTPTTPPTPSPGVCDPVKGNTVNDIHVHGATPAPNDAEGFTEFWARYPRKVAKQAALRAWRRLSPSPKLREAIGQALAWQIAEWEPAYTPHAASWLNGRRWEDERGQAPPSAREGAHAEVARPSAELPPAPASLVATPAAAERWGVIRGRVAAQIGARRAAIWLRPIVALGLAGDELVVAAPGPEWSGFFARTPGLGSVRVCGRSGEGRSGA